MLLLLAGVLAADAQCTTSCKPCNTTAECQASAGCQNCGCKQNFVPGGPEQVCLCAGGDTLKDCMSKNVVAVQAARVKAQAASGRPPVVALKCVVPPKGSTRRVPCTEPTAAPVTTAPGATAPVTTTPGAAAPVTKAPAATVPVTPAAPGATGAPQTVTPATTAPLATVPAATAPGTTAPVVTAASGDSTSGSRTGPRG